jgi:hypothetical protein
MGAVIEAIEVDRAQRLASAKRGNASVSAPSWRR